MAERPARGERAPDFEALTDEGTPLRLSSLRGRPVVLYFYPKDSTPGCTLEACSFRDAFPRFESLDAVVLGVSPDSVRRHANFKRRFDLPFTLIADVDHAVAERYGVWVEKRLFGHRYMGVARTTFLIGADGRVLRVWDKLNVLTHAAEVAEALHGRQR